MEIDKEKICKEYTESKIGVEALATKYHVGKLKIKGILADSGISIKKRGAQSNNREYKVNDWKVKKYQLVDGFHYIAIDRNNGFQTNDWENAAGILTTHIKDVYGVDIPTLYDRRQYYMKTGDYWWEQWFDIKLEENPKTKKCPYCDWETIDIENKSGVFEQHLKEKHNISIEKYIEEHQEDFDYFNVYKKQVEREKKFENKDNYVVCPYCGNKYEKLTEAHLNSCGPITMEEFRKENPEICVISPNMLKQTLEAVKLGNLTVSKSRFVSKYEREIQDFLKENNIDFECNRQILIGKEIDILIEKHKLGIEFDGLKFHTEFFGKKPHQYHLNKTKECNQKGYGLIHIFEDEYVEHKDIVYNKLRHILKLDLELPKVPARKCVIKEIYSNIASGFLNTYHIQGFCPSSIYLGAFYNDELVGVMSFKNGNIKQSGWELTRFATNSNYRCQCLGSKIFTYFIRKYNVKEIISFADRRWTIDINNNLYTNLGFTVASIGRPDYRYYNERVEKYKRVHKMYMNKTKLIKKYGFDKSMTELEMARELGYDRIWDCGLIKYVYKNPNYKEFELTEELLREVKIYNGEFVELDNSDWIDISQFDDETLEKASVDFREIIKNTN